MNQPTTIKQLQALKATGEKFAVLTAYDATQASLCEQAGIDMVLVGDSLGMVVQGHNTTVPVSIDDMIYHAKSVARGTKRMVKMLDMPFMSYAHPAQAIDNSARLMQQGAAEIIKLECSGEQAPLIKTLSSSGVPTCVHLGLRPQTIHKLGRYQKIGKNEHEAKRILHDAQTLEQAGADMILLESVPDELARAVTAAVDIPVIGIGAGRDVDAQVLVIYDILGASSYIPRFAKNFLKGRDSIQAAIAAFASAVKDGSFSQ